MLGLGWVRTHIYVWPLKVIFCHIVQWSNLICLFFISDGLIKMPHAELIAKGNDTLGRKWRKLKKHCSNLTLSGSTPNGINLNKTAPFGDKSFCEFDEKTNITISDPLNFVRSFHFIHHQIYSVVKKMNWFQSGFGKSSADTFRFQTLREKLNSWTKSRPSCQQQQVSTSTPIKKATVLRTSSLKEHQPSKEVEDEDEENNFVRANPVHDRRLHVKSAVISSTNPYCTTSRALKFQKALVPVLQSDINIIQNTLSPTPSPQSSSSASSSIGKDSSSKNLQLNYATSFSQTSFSWNW